MPGKPSRTVLGWTYNRSAARAMVVSDAANARSVVIEVVAFLASSAAGYVTGATVAVDGGRTI